MFYFLNKSPEGTETNNELTLLSGTANATEVFMWQRHF